MYELHSFRVLHVEFLARRDLSWAKSEAENSYYEWQGAIVFRGVVVLSDRSAKSIARSRCFMIGARSG